jgi:CzcA family heavy metal efflux pump
VANEKRGLVRWATRHAALVWLSALALTAGGAALGLRLPSGIYPEVEFPRIIVVARGGDMPPDVAQLVLARPLENALATVLGVERVRSRTIRGGTEISLLFAPGSDMWRALQLVESHVSDARASLPPNTEVSVERLTTSSFPIITFNLSGEEDARVLREQAEYVLKPALSRVRGVGRVDVLGGDVREIEVLLDPARTAAMHLQPGDVADKLRAQAVLQAVGRLEQSHQLVTLIASGEPRDLSDLRNLPVGLGPDGSPILLSAIAEVREGAEDRMLRVGGPEGETVLISVGRLPGASAPDVVERVLQVGRELQASLPKTVHLQPVYNQAELVQESMRSVRDAILIGIGLCIAVLALFLRDARAGLVAALAVPLTLGMTFLGLSLLGQGLNLMSLGGMAVAIGLIIDDAIVVVEAIGRKLEEGANAQEAAERGTGQLFAAVVGTTATTLVVFLPLAWLEGVVGRFFIALAATLCTAVALSMAVALLVVPLAAARWLRPVAKKERQPSRYVSIYTRLLGSTLRRPILGLVCALLLLGLLGLSIRSVPTGFLPTMDEGAFVLDYFCPAGTSLSDTDAVAKKIEAVLKSTPDVATYSRRTGAELGPVTATELSRGDIMVRLRPRGERQRDADEVIADVRARVQSSVPEARTEYIQVLQDVLNDLAGTPRPIEIKLFGEDYRVLKKKAQEIADRIRQVKGLVDLYPGFEGEAPELRFRIDPLAAGRLGESATQLAADLEAGLRGTVAATVRRNDRPIGVRVRYPDSVRFDPQKVETLPLSFGAQASGAPASTVLMSAVASAERVSATTTLLRENLRPVIIVTADHEHRDLGSVVRDVRARIEDLSLPPGYHLELGGQYEGQQETFKGLLAVMGFGLVAVLIVLLAQFRRLRYSLLVLASVPLAVVGALCTLVVTDIPLNASSLMGCVLLVGLVVKNGILLLEQAETLHDSGRTLKEALIEAGTLRVRPILMTTLATIAGLLPLVLGLGSGAELQRPLAVAVVGGLLCSTLVSLFILPALLQLLSAKMPPAKPAPASAPATPDP